jgi:hypothetical protein
VEYDENNRISTNAMIKSALNRNRNSISIDYAIENKGLDTNERLYNLVDDVLSEIAEQTSRLFENAYDSLKYGPEWIEYFGVIDGVRLEMSCIAETILEPEVVAALRVCGQDKAPGPSGLTVRHLRRAENAHLLAKIFNNSIQLRKVPVQWCKLTMSIIPKGDPPYAGKVKRLAPITLLETVQKIFIKTIFPEIMRVFVEKSLFKGA